MSEKRFKLFATCYDKRGRILSYGENSYSKSHPMMKQLSLELLGHSERIYLHAEVQALLRAGDKKVHRLVVQRFDSEGKPALAKPCPICRKALELYGVKELCYTNEYQQITKERI
jgi:deoxycytidylate deaminase